MRRSPFFSQVLSQLSGGFVLHVCMRINSPRSHNDVARKSRLYCPGGKSIGMFSFALAHSCDFKTSKMMAVSGLARKTSGDDCCFAHRQFPGRDSTRPRQGETAWRVKTNNAAVVTRFKGIRNLVAASFTTSSLFFPSQLPPQIVYLNALLPRENIVLPLSL